MVKAKTVTGGKSLPETEVVSVPKPNVACLQFKIRGTTPYVQHKFPTKAIETLVDKMAQGSAAGKKTRAKPPRDFDSDYQGAQYLPSGDSWPNGAIPATHLRAAMINAGRIPGIEMPMTLIKQIVWVVADGYDADYGTPLVRITKGKPHKCLQPTHNANGSTDIRCRPMWDTGWEALVSLSYFSNVLTANDVANLLATAGRSVGIGEGRMASRASNGCGWGSFEIV